MQVSHWQSHNFESIIVAVVVVIPSLSKCVCNLATLKTWYYIPAEEIANTLRETFAKAMAENPEQAAEIARSMAEALAKAGASAEEVASTMQSAMTAATIMAAQNGNGAPVSPEVSITNSVGRCFFYILPYQKPRARGKVPTTYRGIH